VAEVFAYLAGRAIALGPWDFGQKSYNGATADAKVPVVATEGSAVAAAAALLEGLDALQAVKRIEGCVTLRARWVTLGARWVTLRARWVTLRARW
jgi:hypothetical protein